MGEDKNHDKGGKGGGSFGKFILGAILLGALAVGGSFAAAKLLNRPEWNLLNKVGGVVDKVGDKVGQKVEKVQDKIPDPRK